MSIPSVFPLCLREPSGPGLVVSILPKAVLQWEVGVKQEVMVCVFRLHVDLNAEVTNLTKRPHIIQEGKTAIFHILPGEIDVLVHSIYLLRESPQFLSLELDTCGIHISEPESGSCSCVGVPSIIDVVHCSIINGESFIFSVYL